MGEVEVAKEGTKDLKAGPEPAGFYCGSFNHTRPNCPLREESCRNCGKKYHPAKVCTSFRGTKDRKTLVARIVSSRTHMMFCTPVPYRQVLCFHQ